MIIYIIIGFIAQMIDGLLGMAYGVTSRTLLKMFVPIPLNSLSSIVHYSETPSSLTSMISHFKMKNVDVSIFKKLVVSGIIGSVIGAYFVAKNLFWMELLINIYLVVMGVVIFSRVFYTSNHKCSKLGVKNAYVLGFVGAGFDAVGGGYGPIVTSSLLSNCDEPKKVIGTVNASEFFVSLVSSITFFILLNDVTKYLLIVVGLIIGGVIASPIAAYVCSKIKSRKLYAVTGLLLILLNAFNIIKFFVL